MATEAASVIRGHQFPPCLIEPVPAGSKMDLLLSKAKPISAGESTFGIMELRMGEIAVQEQMQTERAVRTRERNSPAGTQVSEGGAGGVLGIVAVILLQPIGKTVVSQLCPWRSTVEQVDAQRRLLPHWKAMLEQPPWQES